MIFYMSICTWIEKWKKFSFKIIERRNDIISDTIEIFQDSKVRKWEKGFRSQYQSKLDWRRKNLLEIGKFDTV